MYFHLATLDDFKTWARFRAELYHDLDSEFNHEEIRRIVADPALATFLVFEKKYESGQVIGMIELSLRNIVDGCLSSPVAYLEGLYLTEKFQGKGLGKEMLDFVKKWAREKGCSELAVDTEIENGRAQKFYLKNGFQETYRIVQFRMGL